MRLLRHKYVEFNAAEKRKFWIADADVVVTQQDREEAKGDLIMSGQLLSSYGGIKLYVSTIPAPGIPSSEVPAMIERRALKIARKRMMEDARWEEYQAAPPVVEEFLQVRVSNQSAKALLLKAQLELENAQQQLAKAEANSKAVSETLEKIWSENEEVISQYVKNKMITSREVV